ncbi:MAG TPA: type IV pilin [Candidatus Methanoperedenaceae archaeon]|nr:type IV pilin [Candidatus Methanoperedenaceae archaeon]
MVAITVILAAVIAAFVFGMGTPKQAPQASIRASSVDAAWDYIKLEHQGGADITLSDVKLIVENPTNRTTWSKMGNTTKFKAGDVIYVYTNSTVTGQNPLSSTGVFLNGQSVSGGMNVTATYEAGNTDITSGYEIVVTMIDVPSGQQIAKTIIRT